MALSAQLSLAAGDISFSADGAYPEGIVWSARQQAFLVSSVRHGTIGKVSMSGAYSPFITDAQLVSSIGMALDTPRNVLWVAIGDPGSSTRSGPVTQGKLAAVASYDASTGKRLAYHDLGRLHAGSHLANDVALDRDGHVYVTDSFSPVVYRITAAGQASVFAQSPRFAGEGFNLNGIVVHPDGYLLVNKHNSGELFRISLADPTRIEPVALPEALKGADGMVLREPHRLTLVQNGGVDRTIDLVSTDGWKSAALTRVQKSASSFPTTAAAVGKDLYVVGSRLDNLMTPGAPQINSFVLEKY